jgi:phosphoribosylglycinamide formyltransferase-1
MKKTKLAILASGNGSNAEAIMKWALQSELAEVVCIGSDRKKAFVHERAKKFSVPSFSIGKKSSDEERISFDRRLLAKLDEYKPDWIILAGYMKLLTPSFLEHFPNRIVNIHPSLLPAFPGTDAYADAYKAKVKMSGCTVHFVDEGLDTGKIIAQTYIPMIDGDTLEDFKKRGLAIENEFYPKVLEKILKECL